MKQYFLQHRQNNKQQYIKEENTKKYRFFNNYMPDLAVIPFYHPPGIYTINKKMVDINSIPEYNREEENAALEVYY